MLGISVVPYWCVIVTGPADDDDDESESESALEQAPTTSDTAASTTARWPNLNLIRQT